MVPPHTGASLSAAALVPIICSLWLHVDAGMPYACGCGYLIYIRMKAYTIRPYPQWDW